MTSRYITAITLTLATAALAAAAPPPPESGAATMTSSMQPPGTIHESLRRELDAAIDRGLDFLAARQQPDGAWSNRDFPALTALPLWAFSRGRHPRRDAVMDKAIAYILTCVHDNGAIYKQVEGRKGGGLNNYNTAICMTALHATGRPALNPIVRQARRFVAGAQYFGDDDYHGGFGYDAKTSRAYTDMLNTYYAAQAMRLTADVEESRPAGETRADIDWNKTVAYIERLQHDADAGEQAGGIVYNPADAKAGTVTNSQGEIVFRAYGSITYAGLLAMVFADVDLNDVRVRSALDWAQRHWTLDENPGMGQEGLYFFYHILTRALNATDRDLVKLKDGTLLNWREEVARRLLALQRIDPDTGHGYWVNEAGRYWENDPVLVTAYSLLALQAL